KSGCGCEETTVKREMADNIQLLAKNHGEAMAPFAPRIWQLAMQDMRTASMYNADDLWGVEVLPLIFDGFRKSDDAVDVHVRFDEYFQAPKAIIQKKKSDRFLHSLRVVLQKIPAKNISEQTMKEIENMVHEQFLGLEKRLSAPKETPWGKLEEATPYQQ
ncbi:hypothetical protein PMAYCL1PPCAC_25301, partial [Pristionchus mayeri]